jgi:hypothetical protein
MIREKILVKLFEDPVDTAENERTKVGAFLQLRKRLLMVERPLHKPAQHKEDSGVHNFVGAAWELDVDEEIRNIGDYEGDNDPHERRQLISQYIFQLFSTFFIAAGK